jgi:DNA-binding LacI/PurR family transcriptional regulator
LSAPRRTPPPTIFDVAEAAGVSITTVSHVYSGKRPVSAATTERVLKTASDLGYQPNKGAQALARGKTMTLALQISLSSHEVVLSPYYGELVPALSQAALALGYAFVLVPPSPDEEAFIAPLLGQRSIDGAILVDPRRDDPFVSGLLEHGIPFVSAGRVIDDSTAPVVDNDHDRICADTLEHMRSQGCEHVVLLNFPSDTSYPIDIARSFAERVPGGPIVTAAELTEPAGFDAAQALLDDMAEIDAILCVNDVLAVGALRALAGRGIRVPDDVVVAGVGDSVLAAHAVPRLTSTKVWPERIGELLVRLLAQELAGAETPPQLTLVPTELVVRESTLRRG